MKYYATVDVPDLDAGVAFYARLGFAERMRPVEDYAVLGAGEVILGLARKPEGSEPAPAPAGARGYRRHWTPVHLDFHVADFEETLARLVEGGAVVEQRHEVDGRPPVAICADPFGNGFCLLAERD